MNGAIKQVSRVFKILKFWKISLKNIIFKNFQGKNSKFPKNGIHVKEPNQLYMCTKFQVNMLQNDQLMAF